MANSEHLTKLRDGMSVWNAWRRQSLKIWPDLCEVNLTGADLRGANLAGTDLIGANLSKADLRRVDLAGANLGRVDLGRANLSGANLGEADLRGANLAGTDLTGANLSEADLRRVDLAGANLGRADLYRADLGRADLGRANLRSANLYEANLRGANLYGANLGGVVLTRALFGETIFANVDLTAAKGSDFCVHGGPSSIDYHTFERSGQLPLSFLRGCGLPDTFIDYLPSLLHQPIQHYSCFISYSSKNDDFVQRLYADLQNKDVRCWFAPEDMKIGDKIWDTIDKAIQLRDKVLLILSRHAINSDWVEDEVTKAYAEERRRKQTILFPIRIDEAVMEAGEPWVVKLRDGRNIGDFCNWKNHDDYQKGLKRLLRDLQIEKDAS